MKSIITKKAQKALRYRGSIYVDIFIDDDVDIEEGRNRAESVLNDISNKIPNSYVGGVGLFNGGSLGLDRDI